MLNIQKFMKTNKDWKKLLAKTPYNLKIRENDGLVLFKYNQYESDFTNPIVKEARGLVLDARTYEVVAYAFDKFFNYGEHAAADVDWNTAVVQEKLDGNLIKVFYWDKQWRVGTNGVIFAKDAPLHVNGFNTFHEVFLLAALNSNLDYNRLDKNYTYMFELCSPHTQVVVKHKDTKLYHIGTRNNLTLKEVEVNIGVEKPKVFAVHSIEEAVVKVNDFGDQFEGFVVVDKNYNRIKIKSDNYLRLHYLSNNNTLSAKRALKIVRSGEEDEVIAYFPHFKDYLFEVKEKWESYVNELTLSAEAAKALLAKVEECGLLFDKNKFAEIAKKDADPYVWVEGLNRGECSVQEYCKQKHCHCFLRCNS